MQSSYMTIIVCFDRDTLTPPQIAELMAPDSLCFEPDYILADSFMKRGGAYRPADHPKVAALSRDISQMMLYAKEGPFLNSSFHVACLQSYGLQTLSWDLHPDLPTPDQYIDQLTSLPGFNAAYFVSSDDYRWQSTEDLRRFEQYGRSYEGLTLTPDENRNIMKVDISKNPGQRHPIPYMWLQSCWRMWFGGKAFTYMPKERLLSFPEARRVEELPSGVVFIELYEDPFAADDPENRRIQQAFRDWVDMDRIQATAHQLFPHAADPTYSMERGEFDHGGVCLLIRWVDKKGKPVPRSQAVKKQMQELDEDGQLVWSGSEPVTPPS